MVMLMLGATPCCCLEARCPAQPAFESYCQCATARIRSGIEITIKCDFQKKEEVVLTKNIYPFRESKAVSASVRIANATSVRVTEGFLGAWLEVLSVGLDLWNCGTVSLVTAPPVYLRHPHAFSTFVGIGLVGCKVPEIPAGLLRDRVTASLLVMNSAVGVVRRGVFQRVRKVRYIVLEDSVVEKVEGSVALEGYVTLHQLDSHRWNGLTLSNTNIHELGPGAFNLTHKANKLENVHKVVVENSRVDYMGRGGITVQGDVAVTIKNNSFGKLEDFALMIDVTRDFKFEDNVVVAAEEGALRGLQCHNFTEMETNMIYFSTERNMTELLQPSFNPFPASCGHSQIFRVVNQALPLTTTAISTSTWVLLVLLLLLVLAVGGVLHRWRENNKMLNFSANNFQSSNGVTSSARYEATQQEVNMMQDGVPNPLYDRTAL